MSPKKTASKDDQESVRSETVIEAIDKHIKDIGALEFAYPLAMGTLDSAFETHGKDFARSLAAETSPADFKKFVRLLSGGTEAKKRAATYPEDGKRARGRPKSFSIPLKGKDKRLIESVTSISNVIGARELISRSFVVTLVSQFDAYLASLVRALYQLRPDILNLHSKTVSFSDLIEIGDAKLIERRLVETEIESVLRDSHSDQFKWFESKFEVKLKEQGSKWASFIELTERRNLFVHANARVSSQYLRVCRNHKVDLPSECQLGSRLSVSSEYFDTSCALLSEIGVKLGIILWRKARPEEQNRADDHLINLTLSLIASGKYALARSILEAFLFSIPEGSRTDSAKRTMIINLAQCLKWLGLEQECQDLLKRFDWSASSVLFRLAIVILRGDFKTSKRLVRNALHAEEIEEGQLEEWPLFREFRDSAEYQELKTEISQK